MGFLPPQFSGKSSQTLLIRAKPFLREPKRSPPNVGESSHNLTLTRSHRRSLEAHILDYPLSKRLEYPLRVPQ